MKQLFLFCLLAFTFSASAQDFKISGNLIDSESGQPLESATVFVEKIQDSTLVAYTISDQNGHFLIEASTSLDSLRMVASYAGYLPVKKTIFLGDEKNNLGTLPMKIATNELGEVMVVATRAPITVSADTLEFNAASFKTRPDANLEDVLEKLPGVEVDNQGNITVNGKSVSRILVNGEEFFGGDPKIASQNLPKELIDKIQVVDTKTKTEEFTGKAGDPDNKTINITIDEDKDHGLFARATAGGGTNKRYKLSGIANYFNGDMRLSALAASNNINTAGFSFDEIMDMMGGRARMIRINSNGSFSVNGNSFGSSGGITKSETAGVNYSNKWNDKIELNANYFFGKNDTETRNIAEQQTFLPNGTYYSNSENSGNVVNNSHRANLGFEVEFDTLTRLSIRPSIRFDNGFSRRSANEETLNEVRELTNSSSTNSFGNYNNSNFGNRISFIRRFGGRGAYLQASFNNNNSSDESENFFQSERLIFENGTVANNQERNQFIEESDKNNEYGLELEQRSVLYDNLFLDLTYEFNATNASNNRMVYNFEETTQAYSQFNETLSNAFEVKSFEHIPNVGLNYEGEKLRVGFNVGLLNTSLETNNTMEDISFKNQYNNLYLNSYIRYEVKKGTILYLRYGNDTDIPSIRQLQPVADVTNPLNIVIGNPELKPTFSQNFRFRLHNFDWASRTGLFARVAVNFSKNEVVPFTLIDDDLVRTTTFRNVDDAMAIRGAANYRKTIKVEKNEYSYSLGFNSSYNKNLGFTNGEKFISHGYRVGPRASVGYNYNDLVELDLDYNLSYNFSKYNLANTRETEFTNHSISLEATSYWPGNWVFGNDISYNYYGNTAPGFDATSILWNMNLGYKFLDDDATISLEVFDLLNENVSTRRSIGQDYIRDSRSLILEQYFMLSFTFKLSKFGGKDPNTGGNRFDL